MIRHHRPVRFGSIRRAMLVVNLVAFMLGIVTIACCINYFAARDALRLRVDATKTRAYSLSPQTRRLLDGLEGDWTIAMMIVEGDADPATLRQIDEVLNRYTEASPSVRVSRIDPTDVQSLGAYESLLGQLQARYQGDIDAYDLALDEGEAAFGELRLFAQRQTRQLQEALARLPADEPTRQPIQQRAELLALLADQGQQVIDEVHRARSATDVQPIADFEGARSILAQALAEWSKELFNMARLFERWPQRTDLEEDLRRFAREAQGAYVAIARELADAADPLRRLPPMPLAQFGRQLQAGETAIVIGPPGAAVIPSSQLLPRSNLRQEAGGISFDQRFRGEQLISSTIRSLIIDPMPLVVFVHAEAQSLLKTNEMKADLVGVARLLEASRFDVQEWIIGQGERPVPDAGQRAVWVIIPPPPARTLQPSPAEQALASTARSLIEGGEPVLLNAGPSLLPRYGQLDPWSQLPIAFGIRVQTGYVIFESVPSPDGETATFHAQAVESYAGDDPISRALNGQQTYIPLPVPVRRLDILPDGVRVEAIASVEPSPTRWLEHDWATDPSRRREPDEEQRFEESVGLVFAAERPHPVEQGTQRCIVVGSGGWMASNVADVVIDVGGGRVALVNPGNHELMSAAVAWLAGLDDLIAASPMSQEVARLRDVSDSVRHRWWWIAMVVLPAACLLLGAGVWAFRRI